MCSRWCFSSALWITCAVLSWLVSYESARIKKEDFHFTQQVWKAYLTWRGENNIFYFLFFFKWDHLFNSHFQLLFIKNSVESITPLSLFYIVQTIDVPLGLNKKSFDTHQNAFVHVAIILAQVHAHPDYTRVLHLTVIHGQGGHGHRTFVVWSQGRLCLSTSTWHGYWIDFCLVVRGGPGGSRRVWRGNSRTGRVCGRGWRGGREGFRHIVTGAMERL